MSSPTASAPTSIPDYLTAPDTPLKALRHIPGDNGWPLLGRLPEMIKDYRGLCRDNYRKYGPISRHGGGMAGSGLLLLGPDMYKELFLDPTKNYSAKMGYKQSIGVFYDDGLLMRDGEDHRLQRRAFQTAFKNESMKGYAELMNPIMGRGLKDWGNNQNFLFFPHIKSMLLDVASKVFFGIDDLGPEADKLNQSFVDVVEKGVMAVLRINLPGFAYHKGWQGKKYMDQFIDNLIPTRRQGDGKDFMSYVAKEKKDNGEYFSDYELKQHLTFLLFAAHDTTTSALSHLVMLLGQHPEIQEQLRQECMALNKPFLEYEDLDKVPNLHNAFLESLRLYPSVSIMTRRTIRDSEMGGYFVPANTVLSIPPEFNHTMPEWWESPFSFDPDRFSAQRAEHKRHAFSFVPFGGGAHKCIGMHFAQMNAKCFMHQFLQQYRFTVPKDYNPFMQTIPLPRPGDFLPLTLERLR